MRLILLALLLCLPLMVSGASIITVSVTVTNGVVGNTNTFTLNGSTRTATNTITASPGTLIQETNSIQRFATNLWVHMGANPVSQFHVAFMSATNVVNIRGFVGESMSATLAGNWGSIAYVTNTIGSPTFTVRVPHTVEANTNQTNIASMLVNYLAVATNALPDTANAGSNYLTLATPQTAPGIKTWSGTNYVYLLMSGDSRITNSLAFSGLLTLVTNGTWYGGTIAKAASISGTLGSLTNGYSTNLIAVNLTVTNLAVPGTAASTLQIGSAAAATASGAIALGQGVTAAGTKAVAVGQGVDVEASEGTAVGYNNVVGIFGTSEGAEGTAIGNDSSVLADGGVAVGAAASVARYHTNSAAIGSGSTTTKTNQIVLGAATHIVTVPGVFEAAATTNAYWRGTNRLSGSLAILRSDHSSLANGANAGVILGTNHWVRIIAGPTAAFSIAGFANGQDGLCYKVSNYTGFPMTISNQSGTEPTAGNRIITGKGADLSVTNYPGAIEIIYDASAARWTLLNYTD